MQKWNLPRRNLQVDDLVLLKDKDVLRNRWQLAHVQEISLDEDGYAHKATLAVGTSSLDAKGRRTNAVPDLDWPIQKLVILFENAWLAKLVHTSLFFGKIRLILESYVMAADDIRFHSDQTFLFRFYRANSYGSAAAVGMMF